MKRKKHTTNQILKKLREADELLAAGKTGEDVAKKLGVTAAHNDLTPRDSKPKS